MILHICRFKERMELPANCGRCLDVGLIFLRMPVATMDPELVALRDLLARLSAYGDRHHLEGVFWALARWAAMYPRSRRGYLFEQPPLVDGVEAAQEEEIAGYLGVSDDQCQKDLEALEACRLIEWVEEPVFECGLEGTADSGGPSAENQGQEGGSPAAVPAGESPICGDTHDDGGDGAANPEVAPGQPRGSPGGTPGLPRDRAGATNLQRSTSDLRSSNEELSIGLTADKVQGPTANGEAPTANAPGACRHAAEPAQPAQGKAEGQAAKGPRTGDQERSPVRGGDKVSPPLQGQERPKEGDSARRQEPTDPTKSDPSGGSVRSSMRTSPQGGFSKAMAIEFGKDIFRRLDMGVPVNSDQGRAEVASFASYWTKCGGDPDLIEAALGDASELAGKKRRYCRNARSRARVWRKVCNGRLAKAKSKGVGHGHG